MERLEDEVDEEEEDGLGVRALFEMSFPTRTVQVDLTGKYLATAPESGRRCTVKVVCSDFDHPGALQSGKFLWPGSRSLSEFMCSDEFQAFCKSRIESEKHWVDLEGQGLRVLELGAGAALVGLTAAKVLSQILRENNVAAIGSVVCTDRDPFLLDMITESAALTDPDTFPVSVAELSWGSAFATQVEQVRKSALGGSFDLVIGADLTYSTETIHLLVETIDLLLDQSTDFIMCSSFRVQESSDILIDACLQRNIARVVMVESIEAGIFGDGVLIEHFFRQTPE